MRLTLVTETFPPEVNGVARTLGRWVDAFQARGHSVQVLRPRRPGKTARPDGFAAWPLPFYPEVRLGFATPRQVSQALRQHRPDLVHIATQGPLGLAALVAARHRGVPVVSSFHTNYDQYLGHYGLGWLRLLGTAYLRQFHNRTRVTLAPSESTRRQLLQQGFNQVEVWPRGVDCQRFHPDHRDPALRARLGLAETDMLVLYVGRISPEKNLAALLEAFHRLPADRAARVQLALVGSGPLLAALRAAKPPHVWLPGPQEGTDLAAWYASADVFAFPSLTETFGNVVLEAQASALPVVAFDYPVLRERITHGADGLLVNSASELSETLRTLVHDPGLRRRLGRAARRRAEAQDWDSVFDRLEARYRDLLTPRVKKADTLYGHGLHFWSPRFSSSAATMVK